jgi:acyl carrier protein
MKGTKLTMITTQDVVELIAASAIEVDTAELRDGIDLFGQGLDSLDMASLELSIERHFGVDISPQQSIRLRTIRDFVDFLNTNLLQNRLD